MRNVSLATVFAFFKSWICVSLTKQKCQRQTGPTRSRVWQATLQRRTRRRAATTSGNKWGPETRPPSPARQTSSAPPSQTSSEATSGELGLFPCHTCICARTRTHTTIVLVLGIGAETVHCCGGGPALVQSGAFGQCHRSSSTLFLVYFSLTGVG